MYDHVCIKFCRQTGYWEIHSFGSLFSINLKLRHIFHDYGKLKQTLSQFTTI